MTRSLLTFLVVGFSLTMVGQPILAHHSESAEFDQSKPVKVTGTISKVEWQNPHVWFYVDVKDESGKITTWGFSELSSGVADAPGYHQGRIEARRCGQCRGFARAGWFE